jgi:Flp pilus assembly protein TadD
MRNFKFVIRAFVGAAALTTLAACEEQDVPRPQRTTVSTPAPKAESKPEVRVEVVPPPVETAKVEPKKVEQVDPADDAKAEEFIGSARKAMDAGELNRALRLARLATKKAPNRSGAWNTLGRVQLKRGERKDAITSFEKAVELNPSSSYAQNNLGLALIYDGKYEDAIEALEEATQLEPVEGYMWNNLGMAYEHMDRLDEARDAYKQAMELKGDRAQENLARLTGVKSIKTAKIDTVGSDVTPSTTSDKPVDESTKTDSSSK